jgi:hypothetical protein
MQSKTSDPHTPFVLPSYFFLLPVAVHRLLVWSSSGVWSLSGEDWRDDGKKEEEKKKRRSKYWIGNDW